MKFDIMSGKMKFLKTIVSSDIAAWLLAFVIAAFVSVLAIWWGALNQDEGWYLYAARMVAEGKIPYRDFFFTQGPALPLIYSVMPIGGMLSGRIVTFAFSLLATGAAIAFARRLVSREKRSLVSLTVFVMLMCNLYHVYFTSIPKTYALGAAFTMIAFLLLSRGWYFTAAMMMAFASGTRISLVLMLGVVGAFLLVSGFRNYSWLKFAFGGVVGLLLMYGYFSYDPASLKGLLAAQEYHAGRGSVEPFFIVGSVSRLARGYLALGAVMFAILVLKGRKDCHSVQANGGGRSLLWMAALSFAAVFLLQMSAPFPYDDYEVPVMPLLTVVIAVAFVNVAPAHPLVRWFPVMVAGMCAFSSPLLQDWMTDGQDRFWTLKKSESELSLMRRTARKIEVLDPGGTHLLTQDLYLAVEAGRKVPEGLEMGPFSYFPEMDDAEAESLHVMNMSRFLKLIDSSPCKIAALSGYGFAIEVPKGSRTPQTDLRRLHSALRSKYQLVERIDNFGQNHTRLDLYLRKDAVR